MIWNHISDLRVITRLILSAGLCLMLGDDLLSNSANAGVRDQAFTMHSRLTGVPPSETVLQSMADRIAAGDNSGAADIAMSNPLFYDVTLKNFVAPWTNKEQNVFVPLNDYTATVIGMIRDDDLPFTDVLTADIVYIGIPEGAETIADYAQDNNQHYQDIDALLEDENSDFTMSDATDLVRAQQSTQPGAILPATKTAGVMTTRAAAEAFFFAGTNRAMFRFTSMNFMCRDLEQLKDVTRPPNYIRQDVARQPGGDSSVFLSNCIGCHSGMDPLVAAFSYYEWDQDANQLIYTEGDVQDKYFINSNNFPLGYVTPNDAWVNHWRTGPNARLGWGQGTGQGNGAKSLGAEMASSRAFSTCQVQKVFKQVCLRKPSTSTDLFAVERIADSFEQGGYRMKSVFAETAAHCMGD